MTMDERGYIGNKLWLPKEIEGKGNYEFGINVYTLLYIKYVNKKDLPYSTRNYS